MFEVSLSGGCGVAGGGGESSFLLQRIGDCCPLKSGKVCFEGEKS